MTGHHFGLSAMPKEGDAVQIVVPGEATQHMHPAMAGASGQVINMAFNAPSPHLTFKEWMARGVVGGFGKVLAFPFTLAGSMLTSAGNAIVDLVKMAVLIILIPTLLWMGFMLYQKVSKSQSIEEGTAMIVTDAKRIGTGVSNGIATDTSAKPPQTRPQSE
jgi:hypothetical protein